MLSLAAHIGALVLLVVVAGLIQSLERSRIRALGRLAVLLALGFGALAAIAAMSGWVEPGPPLMADYPGPCPGRGSPGC